MTVTCDACGKWLTTKADYAQLVVNKTRDDGQQVIFTWTYCDVMCIAIDWKVGIQ